MDGLTLQTSLFTLIEKKLGTNQKLSTVIQDFFDVSLNSAYRKIRGDSMLSLDELVQLAKHFHISLDALMRSKQANLVQFRFRKEVNTVGNIHKYFERTTKQFNELAKDESAQLFYAARDLPLFLYFCYPHLAAFKVGFWLKTQKHLHLDDLKSYFKPEVLGEDFLATAKKLSDAYQQFPTQEIWTLNTLNTTLNKLEHCKQLNLLSEAHVKQVYQDLLQLLEDKLSSLETEGVRSSLYKTEYLALCSGAYLAANNQEITFLGYSGINFIQTSDTEFGQDFKAAFDIHKNMGILLSNSAQAERTRFFNYFKERIKVSMNK